MRAERSTTLIALGGGVIGDLAGFAAATYQRGMPLVQIPTTLLAQVDSSVGGKTGINHPLGKNMIGAFYQPRAVVSDSDTPAHAAGARVHRRDCGSHQVRRRLRDAALFEWLEANMERLLARDPTAIAHAVLESCRIKAEIVAADERESGVRALLNFGHTFGHAIEAATGYGAWLHGEAVAAGMIMAARAVATRCRPARSRRRSPARARCPRRTAGSTTAAGERALAGAHAARQEGGRRGAALRAAARRWAAAVCSGHVRQADLDGVLAR